ncbi:DMT family transporter [Roseburia sp. 499]|uniref:DMT family transporter n=1 Tax=Roseburia sp. 499 TaxID=1261634 RepID=UPI000952D347|nr:DMT family transporter [Roseburia sp. 499]WVK68961.1 DMT family transporter [Roseburia sp. 499]
MSEKNKGIFYIILAALCFSLMSLFVRLSGDIPSMQKSFFRNLVALIFSLFILWKEKIPFHAGKGNTIYLILRAAFGTLGLFCNFYAIDHLALSDANMLNKLSPFFAIIFSYFLLKEKVAPYQLICVITAFIGTLFILRPGFGNLVTFPALIGLLGGLGAGIAYTMVRVLSGQGVKGPFIVFFFSAFSCIVTLPFFIFNYTPMKPWQLGFLLLAGLAASGGQFSITAAYSHAPAKEISVYDYTQIIFSSLWGILFLGELPNWMSVTGYVIIFGASLTMFLKRQKEAQKREN